MGEESKKISELIFTSFTNYNWGVYYENPNGTNDLIGRILVGQEVCFTANMDSIPLVFMEQIVDKMKRIKEEGKGTSFEYWLTIVQSIRKRRLVEINPAYLVTKGREWYDSGKTPAEYASYIDELIF